jgi:multidrug efflux pump subunit AcrA (membrane-fusion protein)
MASSFFSQGMTFRHFATSRPVLIAVFALAALTGGTGVLSLQSEADEALADSVQLLPVETIKIAGVGQVALERTYTGEIVAERSSSLSFEQGGLVIEVLVDEGERVAAGQTLARLDTLRLQAQRRELAARRDASQARLAELEAGPREEDVARAHARVRELQAGLDISRREYQRLTDLFKGALATDKEYQDAINQHAAAEAQLDGAREVLRELLNGTRPEQIAAQLATVGQLAAAVERVGVDLRKSELVAPFAGSIAERHIDEGTVIAAGRPVLELIEQTALEARIGVPIEALPQLAQGSVQRLRVGEREAAATVKAILPRLDRATRTATVVLTIASPEELAIAPGRIARLNLKTEFETAGFWIPATALVKSARGLWAVYALCGTDRRGLAQLERRDVEILHVQPDRVFVRGLLASGEQLVARGAHRVAPNQLVTVAESQPPQTRESQAVDAADWTGKAGPGSGGNYEQFSNRIE